MKIKCPHCGKTFDCPEEYVGKKVKCLKCQERFVVETNQPLIIEHQSKDAEGFEKKPQQAGKNVVIAQIGQNYLTSIVTGAGFSSTSLVLTNRTLSGAGKTYTAKSKGSVSFSGDVRNLSSIGIRYLSYWILLLLGIISFPLGIIFIILYFVTKQRFIEINFQGVVYSLSMRGIDNKEAQIFIDKVLYTVAASQLKDGK